MLEDLVGCYKSVDGNTKRKILGCIFSEKLHLEEKKVATPKFTTPIQVLLNASTVLQNCKNKKEVNNRPLTSFSNLLGYSLQSLFYFVPQRIFAAIPRANFDLRITILDF
jgi:hypothetical protein